MARSYINVNTATRDDILLSIYNKKAKYVSIRGVTYTTKRYPRINNMFRGLQEKGLLVVRYFENERYERSTTPFYALTDEGHVHVAKLLKKENSDRLNHVTRVRTVLKNCDGEMTTKEISRAIKKSHSNVITAARYLLNKGEVSFHKDEDDGVIYWSYND